ncbi:MAG: GIY-YIG nuclease family protein [Pirellulales bacterium]|nr:GIY-YIG nuclease family protein [Pirellulales bacterium]
MQSSWTPDNYPYRGVAVKPNILAELAEKYVRPGAVLKRQWLIKEAPRIHVELGGIPANTNATQQAKRARTTLLEQGWEQAGLGAIRRPGEFTAEREGDIKTEDSIEEQDSCQQFDALEWRGVGDETVYCYTFPCHIELAALKGESLMPIKIGSTSSPGVDRVAFQCGVSNPENPVVLLGIRVEESVRIEKTIQRILMIWNRWIEDAPGTEWFLTSKEEILEIWDFLQRSRLRQAGTN